MISALLGMFCQIQQCSSQVYFSSGLILTSGVYAVWRCSGKQTTLLDLDPSDSNFHWDIQFILYSLCLGAQISTVSKMCRSCHVHWMDSLLFNSLSLKTWRSPGPMTLLCFLPTHILICVSPLSCWMLGMLCCLTITKESNRAPQHLSVSEVKVVVNFLPWVMLLWYRTHGKRWMSPRFPNRKQI